MAQIGERNDRITRLGSVSCAVQSRSSTAWLVSFDNLPFYPSAPSFLVEPKLVEAEHERFRCYVNVLSEVREKNAYLVDVPGEALNFGRRVLVPMENVTIAPQNGKVVLK